MAATPKPVRKVVKRLLASTRKQVKSGMKKGNIKKSDLPSKKKHKEYVKSIVKKEQKTHGWVK